MSVLERLREEIKDLQCVAEELSYNKEVRKMTNPVDVFRIVLEWYSRAQYKELELTLMWLEKMIGKRKAKELYKEIEL